MGQDRSEQATRRLAFGGGEVWLSADGAVSAVWHPVRDHVVATAGGRRSRISLLFHLPLRDIVERRVRFVVDHQRSTERPTAGGPHMFPSITRPASPRCVADADRR